MFVGSERHEYYCSFLISRITGSSRLRQSKAKNAAHPYSLQKSDASTMQAAAQIANANAHTITKLEIRVSNNSLRKSF